MERKLYLQISPQNYISIDLPLYTPKFIQAFNEGFLKYLSEIIVEEIKTTIRHQLLNWHPLSKTYKAWKARMDLDPRIWIASGELEDSIKIWHSQIHNAWIIGVNPYKKHHVYTKGGIYKSKKNDVLLIDIIRSLEFGTQKIPARPLFTVVFNRIKRLEVVYYKQFVKDVKANRYRVRGVN